MDRQHYRVFRPAIILFIILNAVFLLTKEKLESWGFDISVLLLGNILLFLISLLSFRMLLKGLKSKSNAMFLRMFYGSFMVKLFLLAIAAFIYIMSAREMVNKPALFTCMGIYIIYTFIEISGLMKINKVTHVQQGSSS